MAFNFPPPLPNQNANKRVQEHHSGLDPASFSRPPPFRASNQSVINYNIPPPPTFPPPAYQQPRFPRWEHPRESEMPWNTAHHESSRVQFQHFDQDQTQPAICSSSLYPIAATPSFTPSDQSGGNVGISCDPIQCRAQDEIWLQNRFPGCRSSTAVHSTEREVSKTLKVFEAKNMLKQCLYLLQKLEESQQELLAGKETLSIHAWQEKWNHIKGMQNQVVNALTEVSSADNMKTLVMTLAKRQKKRLAQKRRKKLHQEMKKEAFLKRQQLHANINAWLKNMEEVVEKAKREESLKHEADLVLGEVTRKKTEARRQLSLLSALLKLRQIRAQRSANKGQPVSEESSIRFAKVIEHLQQLWEEQLRGYNVEEQGLRVMLEEAVEERTQSYDRQAVGEWNRLLFGSKSSVKFRKFYLAAECNLEAFVAIRKSWDRYLAPPDAVMSSAIPVGWVLPTNPSSQSWEKHLKPY